MQPGRTSPGPILDALDYWIKLFDGMRRRNKVLCTCIRIVIVLISGLITVSLAVDLSGKFPSFPSQYFKLIAIILSAVGGALSTFEAFIDHKRLWVQSGVALSRTTLLRQRVNVALVEGELDVDLAQAIMNELNDIVGHSTKDWADGRTRSPDLLEQETFGHQRRSHTRKK